MRLLTRKLRTKSVNCCLNRFSPSHGKSLPPYVDPKLSYAYGRGTGSLEYTSIGKALERTANKFPNKTAVISVHQNFSKTFTGLNNDVTKLSKTLIEDFQLAKGSVVGTWSTNYYEYFVAQHAMARAGLVHCSLSPLFKSSELEYVVHKSGLRALFMPSPSSEQNAINNFGKVLERSNLKDSNLERVVYMDGDQSPPAIEGHKLPTHNIQQILETSDGQLSNSSLERVHSVDPDDTATLFFTSGTTGKPKGAASSHFIHHNNALVMFRSKRQIPVENQNVSAVPIPLFHAFAGVLCVYGLSACGLTMALTNLRYTAQSFVEGAIKVGATEAWLVPTMVVDVLNYCQTNNLTIPGLKILTVGAAACPPDVVKQAFKTFPSLERIIIAYGCTETGPVITYPNSDIPQELNNECVGSPIDFAEVKIVNRDTGLMVPLGEAGELCTRGHHVMKGYWDEPEKTKEVLKEGWYSTGDMATLDKDGMVRIVGRTKELIIRGGANIYPAEVEDFLHEHPDVQQAAVCGVPHDRLGEEVVAWIKLKDVQKSVSVQEIRDFCKDKMSYYKVPAHVFFVEAFPMTATGKYQKFKMTEESIEMIKSK